MHYTNSFTRHLLSGLGSSPESRQLYYLWSRVPFVSFAAWGMSLLETSSSLKALQCSSYLACYFIQTTSRATYNCYVPWGDRMLVYYNCDGAFFLKSAFVISIANRLNTLFIEGKISGFFL